MVWRVALLATLLAALLPAAFTVRPVQGQTELPERDVIILLDVTISMRGEGGGDVTDIWDEVSARVEEQIGSFSDGTNFAVIPFDQGPRLSGIWPQAPPDEAAPIELMPAQDATRANAIEYVAGLEPDGLGTWICESMAYALDKLKQWGSRPGVDPDRIQTVYLYTDGDEEGAQCAGNFVESMFALYNAETSEYPFLNMVYIDLRSSIDPAEIPDGPGPEIVQGLPDVINLNDDPQFLGNLAEFPDGVTRIVRIERGELTGPDGQPRSARLRLLPAELGVTVDAEVQLAPEMTITFRGTENTPPGQYNAILEFVPIQNDYIFDPTSVIVTFSWDPAPPTPTPEPTATATPLPTATPPPTLTPTPLPTATLPPPPTATPAPTATPVPVPGIIIEREETCELGELDAGSEDVLEGSCPLTVAFNPDAQAMNAGVDLEATLNGDEDSEQFWLIDPVSGGQVSELTLQSNGQATQTVQVGYRINAPNDSRFWPGGATGNAAITATSPDATVGFEDQGEPAGGVLAFSYTVNYPLSPLFILSLLLLVLLILLIVFFLLHARFPRQAQLRVDGGMTPIHYLRAASERTLLQRFFPRTLGIGSSRDVINVETGATVARLSPRAHLFSMGTETYIEPVGRAVHPVQGAATSTQFGFAEQTAAIETAVRVNGVPLTARRRLRHDDEITTNGGLTAHYFDGASRAATQPTPNMFDHND